jgi:hypothetical protein
MATRRRITAKALIEFRDRVSNDVSSQFSNEYDLAEAVMHSIERYIIILGWQWPLDGPCKNDGYVTKKTCATCANNGSDLAGDQGACILGLGTCVPPKVNCAGYAPF